MKRTLALILCLIFALSASACGSNSTEPAETTALPTETTVQATEADLNTKINEQLDNINFEGIVYITQNGSPVFSQATGKNEKGGNLTLESPMYIGSVSKQFCATAIMILQNEGKLSINDTLDKYFPEYELGKDITIKNLLTMRSGVPEMLGSVKDYSADKTEEENTAIIKEWIFSKPLDFEPDTSLAYSNTNYFLLGNIVEMASETSYNDFIRENIFAPLEMNNSGFISEVETNPFFFDSLTYDTFTAGEDAEGLTKGAGDIVSTAYDMEKWMNGIRSGKIISTETFAEMTADYSPDFAMSFGYGFSGMNDGGTGIIGSIGDYIAIDYINPEHNINIFVATNSTRSGMETISNSLMRALLG